MINLKQQQQQQKHQKQNKNKQTKNNILNELPMKLRSVNFDIYLTQTLLPFFTDAGIDLLYNFKAARW